MRHSDRPITQASEDVLDRKDFARALGHAIDHLSVAKDGFVIGLIGPWGSGKSSVVEMTLRNVRHQEMVAASAGTDTLTLDQLDLMSNQFAKIEPVISSFRNTNLDVTLWERQHRDREFLRSCGSPDEARLASKGLPSLSLNK